MDFTWWGGINEPVAVVVLDRDWDLRDHTGSQGAEGGVRDDSDPV